MKRLLRQVSRDEGFTLIELIIGGAIAAVAAVAVMAFFIIMNRTGQSQQMTGEVQQDVRMAAEFLARDIRSAGFVIGPYMGIEIEQKCGDNPATTESGWTSPLPQHDACPNGSDRITIHYQLPNQRLIGCPPAICSANTGNHIVIPEPNALCPAGHPCVVPGPVVNGIQCDMNSVSIPTTLCDPNNTNCVALTVTQVSCDAGCGAGGFINPDSQCVDVKFSSNPPTPVRNGPLSSDLSIVYQLLDVDGDGSTELVRSINFIGQSGVPSTIYQVVAPNIDDLQFAVNETVDPVDFRNPSSCTGDACFFDRDIYNGSPTIAPGGTAATYANGHTYTTAISTITGACSDTDQLCTGGSCTEKTQGTPNGWGCSSRVRALQFKLAGRTRKVLLKGRTDPVDKGYHVQLRNNAQALTAYNASPTLPIARAAGVGACATSGLFNDYLTCSLSGNAQGYRWRVISDTVLMRNLAGSY